jgi:hypothetical protein
MRVRNGLLAIAVVAPSMSVWAQGTPPGMIRAVPDRPTRVFIMAAFDDECRSLPAPAIEVSVAPKLGSVQFREGQSTTVQYSLSGKCVGTRVTGTGIYYAARGDASGEDTFTISARSANGEVATRTFRMFVSDGI